MLAALEATAIGRKLARALVMLALAIVAAAIALTAGDAAAQAAGDLAGPIKPPHSYGRSDPLMPVRIDARIVLDWNGALGLGGRVDIPLVATSTLRYSRRDEVSLSLGVDGTFIAFNGSSRLQVYPSFAFQWSLGVSDRFFFYPEVGITARIDAAGWDGISPNLGFATRYYLHRSFGLFGRLGWPMALSGGVVF